MSKVQLKRELTGLSKDQLIEVILDAYAARKEIKDYFDFYINPDVVKLRDKYFNNIRKEFNRTKRGYSKARVSQINKLLKEFEGYAPGSEAILNMYTLTISLVMCIDRGYHLSETQCNWFSKLATKALVHADENERMAYLLEIFNDLLDTKNNSYGSETRQILSDTISDYKSSSTIR